MDSPLRTLIKALTWQATGLVTMTIIGFVATGSLRAGGSVALVSAATGLVFYALHERLWARVHWGLTTVETQSQKKSANAADTPHGAPVTLSQAGKL